MTRTIGILIALSLGVSAAVAAQPTEEPSSPTMPPPTTPTPPTTPPTAPPPTTTPAMAPTDAQIAHVVVTANTLDMAGGKMARSRTKNPSVKAFAERMVEDHDTANDQLNDLVKRLDMKPEDNPTSARMKGQHEEVMERLRQLDGEAFDRAYVEHEVVFHATVLDSIDRVLLPNATSPDLRAMLTQLRPTIATHLEHARQLQQELAAPTQPTL